MNKPVWRHNIDERTARWIASHRVDKIVLNTEMHSEDSWSNYLVLHCSEPKSQCKAPPDLFISKELVIRSNDNRGIVTLAVEVEDTLDQIDAWKKRNQRELAEYKRLKKKFEGVDLGEDT